MPISEFVSAKSLTLHGVFEAQVEKTPEAIALVFDQEQLTYRELNERANQLAHYLRSLNVAPEMLVGICLERSIEMIVGMLGILKAGAAFVPLDPSLPQERKALILADTKVEVLLTLKKLVAGIPVPSSRLVCLDAQENSSAKSKSNPKSGVQPENLAYTIYTSGSTGQPKGVMVSHQAICQGFLWMQEIFPITVQDRILQKMPLTFDFSFWELFWPLMTGACVVLAKPGGEKDSAYVVQLIARQKISILVFVPSVLQVFLSEESLRTCKTIRMVFTGGESLTSALKDRFFHRLPDCQLYDLFGATENIIVTYWPCQPGEKLSSFPQGRPFPNLSIYVVDEQLQPVPVGEIGELLVGGWGLARGYLNLKELTAQKFISNPFQENSQERLYRTGDQVRYLSDGTIEILGRIDNQVKIRGFRIELGEIEQKLSQHPAVKQVAVIAREDVAGDKRLVAYVVLHSSQESEPKFISELRHFLQQQLPDYMMPSSFVVLEALPLSPNHKVDRRALPIPEIRPADLPTFVAPRTPIEEMLASIWANILRVEFVGIHDNFFTLGGHSLLAAQIIARMRVSLGVELPFSRLLEFPTVAGLVKIVEEVRQQDLRPQALPIQPISRNQTIPLSFSQEQLWFLHQLTPEEPIYNELCTIRLKGAINVDALEKALNEIIKRHESLRTRVITVDGQPVQAIDPPDIFNLTLVDLRQFPQQHREAEALRLATKQAKQPFDLSSDRLLRATLMQLADVDYRLFLTFHHIVMDGVSIRSVFLPELAALYEAYSKGKPSPLAPLPVQYADFAVWQRQWLTQEILSSLLDYWKQQLADLPVLQLPYDRRRSAVGTFRGAWQCLVLSFDLTESLKALSQQSGVTLYMTLLAAFKTLLYRYSGSEDIVVGTMSANRNRPDIEGLIGFFINTLVLRTDMSGNPSFRQLLLRVREVTLGAYAHQDLPYQKLVQTLQPERNLSQNPLFQVAFVQEAPMPSLNSDWTRGYLDIQTDTAKFDLSLELDSRPEGIVGRFEYNTDLFEAATISRMIGHFTTMLAGIVANPQARVSELPLLTERERYQLLFEWNNTTQEYPQDKCIHQLFEEQVERTPDAIAVVFEDKQLTYLQLNQRANCLAHHLKTLGVGPEVLVGICVERSLEMVVGLLGILKAGGAYVPLDTKWPTQRIQWILSTLNIQSIITQSEQLRKLHDLQWKLPRLSDVICLDVNTPKLAPEPLNTEAVRSLWDHIAERAVDQVTAGGFISSYTGMPFSEAEVAEYRNHVVKLAQTYLEPHKRVFEIGCGSGLIAFAIAPHVNFYLGLDPSEVTQARNRQFAIEKGYSNLKFQTGFAHEMVSGEANSFDLIVVASTIQFFPGPIYLQQVIEKALQLLVPGGVVLIADILDSRRKDDFKKSLEEFCTQQLDEPNIKTKTQLDSELYLDEDFFCDLQEELPQIADVKVLHREQGFPNELRYRYDVILQKADSDSISLPLNSAKPKKRLWTAWNLNQLSQSNLSTSITSNNVAYVIHTSGSTGVPKGVVVRHQSAVNLIDWVNKTFRISTSDRILFTTSLCFDLSVYDIFGMLASGGSIRVASRSELQEPKRLVNLLCHELITFWDSAPAALQQLVPFFPDGESKSNKSQLRLVFLSGDWIPLTLPHTVTTAFPDVEVIALGGATEATIWSNYYQIAKIAPQSVSIPYGKPIQNAQYYILDSYLNPCPIGVCGELYIGGVCLASGYTDPAQTAEKFIPNPFSDEPDSRLYKTGDNARYLSDGNIEFLGRIDNQVKVRGFRIELGEIETVLTAHPQVSEAVVIVREDTESNKSLVAYVVVRSQSEIKNQLRDSLKQKLPDYMVPGIFVMLEALPLTPNGKVDRRALPEPELRPEPELTFVAPRTPIEEMLVSIWASVLSIEQVGVHDNFFELGGHSLLATEVISRVQSTLTVELPVRSLFEAPTVAKLANCVQIAIESGQGVQAPPLLPIPRSAQIPLSFAQARLWFLDQLEPDSAFYNVPLALRLSGQLNSTALELSLNEITRRHEVLRSNVRIQEGQPVTVISATLDLKLEIVDLLHLPESEREVQMQRLANAEAVRPFDLEREPLVRVTLLQLGETEHVLLLTLHHIITDGWSLGLLYKELATLYCAFCTDQPPVLPELPVQYADFAVWQRNWLQGEVLQKQLDYWKQQLKGIPTLLELPTARPRRAVQSFRGAYQSFALSLELSEAIASLSKRTGVTLFMTLLAAFVTLLYRYTDSEDIVVGTPIANRNRPEIEGLIGFFVNTLVLRTQLQGNPSFEQLLLQVREVALGAYTHQDLPFEELVEALQPSRSLSHSPLCQVIFALQNAPMPSMDLPDLTVNSLFIETGTTKFDLTLSMENTSSGLIASWQYNTDLFDDSTIARMAGHFQTLLEALVANPQQRVSELSLLTPQERQQLLIGWNNTTKEYPFGQCIHHLFEEQVERNPDAIAVVFEDKQLTYRELNQRANRIAHYLKTLGVGPEVLVGSCVESSSEMVVGLLGILKAGGAYVPLDPAYPSSRIDYLLNDSQLSVLLTQQKLVTLLPEHQARVVCLDADWEEISVMPELPPISGVTPGNLAYLIYTSGSTGKPKGVLIAHRGLCNLATARIERLDVQPDSRVLQFFSLSFDASISAMVTALCAGATLCLGTSESLQPGQPLLRLLQEQRITHAALVPSALATLPTQELPILQNIIVGGEPCPTNIVASWVKGRRFFNAYGPTESTICATVAQGFEGMDVLPIGHPLDNTHIYILDRYLQPVPIGVPGELHIASVGLARGYLNRPDLTASKFIPNPFSNEPGERLYKTGDLARYLSDGNIEFLGRLDNQVKIRGFRIELGEIEAAIAFHPAVRQTLVVVREDVPGHKYLVAYIVPNYEGAICASLRDASRSQQRNALASSDLRSFLREKLPDYMIPGVFVMLSALPLTPNGKVDRKALPVPNTARQELQADQVAPRTRFEEILAQIWCEVFHRELLSIHDNFFELGGDSILSIQIISSSNLAGLHLTPKQIFQHQTIAELAAVATTTETKKAFQGLVTGSLPLTPIQHWFFAQNLPDPHHFNQAFLLLFPPTLNPNLLQQALQQLLRHHDALRLRFNQSEDGWQQYNALPDETVPFSLIDLSTLQEGALSKTIESTSDQLQASLNLNSGPLLRVALFHLGTQKPSRLLLVIHHLAVDGVSWRILLEDIKTVYKQLESGKPIQLQSKTTSFKHWAEKLTEYAQSPAATKELTYWSNISTSKITRFPVDCNRGANIKASARSVNVSLNVEETRALLQEIHQAYHTQINDILLTALVQVLATWSGSESVLINLEGHGREEIFPDVDLSRTVGWFTTIFPVLLELKATENLGDAIQSIKEQLRAIPNRGLGYGLLRYLSGDASITSQLSCLPQAEVSFNYLGQFDWGMQSDSFIKLASESVGPEHSQLGQRSHLLEINGLVVENQLQLEWRYSDSFHSWATIESLAQDFAQALRTLIAHCLSTDASGYTPDAFENHTLPSLGQQINNDQRQENKVTLPLHLLELQEDISELLPLDTESAYPLAKMQEFMLHHYCNDAQKRGVYHCQQSYDIYDESLDLNAFEKALLILVQKHPALRSVFITSNGKPVVQVVRKKLRFSISEQDISHIKSEEQSNYIDAVMKQDRQNLFNVENPDEPLFRFRIFRKAENRFEFLMSIHHAITDGWSGIEFLNQLYELYLALKKGEEITVVSAANVYQEFVALEKEIIDSLDASNFWKLHLKNHTYKPLKPLTTSTEQVDAVTEKCKLDLEIIADLRELCRILRVSPKALFLSTYLDFIGTVMKSNRVCVGIISNGRTERLSDPFGALGLFWNIVPFCQPTVEDKGVQIKNVQQSLIDMEPYVRYPLLQILSDQQKPELFFATFNFVHFHNAKNLKVDTGLKVKARRSHDKFNFPLNYTVSMSPVEGNVSLSVAYDRTYFSRQEICSMIQNYIEILKHTVHTFKLY